MGLFDYQGGGGLFGDPNQAALLQIGLGLLSGSGPSRTPQSLGQIFGQAGQQAMAGYQQAMHLQQQRQHQMAQDDLTKVQVQQHQAALEKERQAQESAQKLRTAYAGLPGLSGSLGGAGMPTPAMPGNAQIQLPTTGGGVDTFRTGDVTPMQTAPQGAPSTASRASGDYQRFKNMAQYFESKGFPQEAEKYYLLADKNMPEIKESTTLMQNGIPVRVNVFKDGSHEVVPNLMPAEKLSFHDTGQGIEGLNQYTGATVSSTGKKQTLESLASNAVTMRGQNMTDARAKERFNLDQITPQYMETTAGIVALPKKLGQGEVPRGVLATDAQGQPLEKKKDVPQFVVTGVTKNAKALASIDSALQSLKTPGGQNAVGMKGYLPAQILNRMDQSGVDTRANIADVGSLEIHDRSGAAVTVSEFPRFAPFVPLATDDAATVQKKLTRLKQLIESETNNLTFQYPGAKKLAEFAASQNEQKRSGQAQGEIKKYNQATGRIE